MKKMKMYLVMLVVSMLLPMRVSAQTVKGKLVDESNHPLPYANVVLLSLPDSEGTPPAAQAAGTRPAVRARTSRTDRKRDNIFVCMEKTPSKLQNYGCAVGGFLPLHRL